MRAVTLRQRVTRDERGAFAVLFAVMIVMLLTLAALGTDLGNAISRKTDTQNQADFAAFDAGQKYPLDIASGSALTASSPVVIDVAASLNKNQPEDDDSPCWRNVPVDCITPNQLVNTNLADGEVRYADGGLQVVAPLARVDFGFANVFGTSGTSVQSAATVNVFSPGPRVLPMFAVSGCDYGHEALIDAGSDDAYIPDNLAFPGKTGTPTLTDSPAVEIHEVGSGQKVDVMTPGGGPYRVWVYASNWRNTWRVGFFRNDGSNPEVTDLTGIRTTAGTVVTGSLTGSGAYVIDVPSNVVATKAVWWIRAWGGDNSGQTDWVGPGSDPAGGNEWSRVGPQGSDAGAQPVRVGDAEFPCDSASSAGNFGTLSLPNSDATSSNEIAYNIANGLDPDLNLVVHKDADSTGRCVNGTNKAVESWRNGGTVVTNPDTNCVGGDTGALTLSDAMDGFFTWSGNKGLLANGRAGTKTADGCGPNGGGYRSVDPSGPTQYLFNDDRLSCFLLPGKTLDMVDTASTSVTVAFTDAIYDSPRFAWVPILKSQPLGGTPSPCNATNECYSIVDFRPAFITDETEASTDTSSDATLENGLDFQGGDNLKAISVFFFNWRALPRGEDAPVIDYLGVGDPIVHMIN
jgi:hypothetical protein